MTRGRGARHPRLARRARLYDPLPRVDERGIEIDAAR